MKHYGEFTEAQTVERSLPFPALQRKLELIQRMRPQANSPDAPLRVEPPYEDLCNTEYYEQTIDIEALSRKLSSQYNSSPLISMEAVLQAQQRALAALQELETALQQATPSSKTLVPEVTETMERILHSVRTTVEPGTWAPSLEDLPQLATPSVAERVTPPLPTAEDMAKDPTKTWVGRDKSIRVLDEEGQLRPETPLDLFKRVYGPWVGVITKGHIKHIDLSLYTAFNHWTKNRKNTIPEAILPNMVHRWKDSTPTPEEIKIYNKVNALMRRRA